VTVSDVFSAVLPNRDPDPPRHGPVTRARLRRTGVVYLLMLAVGAALVSTRSGFWGATGVGLWFPGAGFLAAGGWWSTLTPIVLLFFVASLIAWFGSGFTTAPPVIWLGAALLAGWAAAGESVSMVGVAAAAALVVVVTVGGRMATRRSYRAKLRRRAERLAYLPAAVSNAATAATAPPSGGDIELNADALAALRYVIDRGLQQPGDFTGYDKIDQFQTSALRYQINYLGYALAVAQAHYTPNFHGYFTRAQCGLIDTYLDRRVWSYWAWENAWGNLRLNADPVGKDNIMLTGYFGLQVGLYTALTATSAICNPAV
jgi:Linalool dehydratase/isomerase